MFQEYNLNLELDDKNKDGLIQNIISLTNTVSIELVPAFKLRNTNPQHFFDNFCIMFDEFWIILINFDQCWTFLNNFG